METQDSCCRGVGEGAGVHLAPCSPPARPYLVFNQWDYSLFGSKLLEQGKNNLIQSGYHSSYLTICFSVKQLISLKYLGLHGLVNLMQTLNGPYIWLHLFWFYTWTTDCSRSYLPLLLKFDDACFIFVLSCIFIYLYTTPIAKKLGTLKTQTKQLKHFATSQNSLQDRTFVFFFLSRKVLLDRCGFPSHLAWISSLVNNWRGINGVIKVDGWTLVHPSPIVHQ